MVPLSDRRGAGSCIVGDGPLCMLSDGLQIQMTQEEDPPISRDYLARRIACDESDDVKRYASRGGLVQGNHVQRLRHWRSVAWSLDNMKMRLVVLATV